MFLDASAIVAILAGEDDAADLIARIEGHGKPLYYSAVSAFEATISLAKIFALSHGLKDKPIPPPMIQAAQGHISTFFDLIGAEAVAIDAEIDALSVEAASRFGRHVGHPARLNIGDCLAYACCKKYRIPLLFKGNDFTQTDIDRV